MKALLKAGADVNKSNNKGFTPLIVAARYGSDECIKPLVEAGADVNARNKKNLTSLMISAYMGHSKCVSELLRAGANVNMSCDGHGNGSLYWAAKNGHSECLHALLEAGASVNKAPVFDDFVPLIAASRQGQFECVNMLIQAGADVNRRNTVGDTAFILAAVKKRYEILKHLLNAGADVNASPMYGRTALTGVACRYDGHGLQMLRFLLRIGVKINLVGYYGNALTECLRSRDEKRESALLLFAAGETIDESALETVPEYLLPQKDINLLDICRGRTMVPRLGLPATVTDFLVYNQTLDDTKDD